jgi:hypothetical protein
MIAVQLVQAEPIQLLVPQSAHLVPPPVKPALAIHLTVKHAFLDTVSMEIFVLFA